MVVPLGRAVRDAQRRAVLVGLVLTLPIIPCRAVGRDTPGAPPNATDPSKTVWIGQPPDYRFEWGALGGYGSEADQGTYRLAVGLEGRLKAPQFGLLDLAMEGAYGRLGLESGAAFGTYLKIPFIWTGIEYDTEERTPYVRFSLQGAPRRGGLLGRGDRLRLDYTPGRKAIEAGFKMPFPWADYRATRPRNSHVELPKGSLPSRMSVDSAHSSAQAMDRLRHSMTWVDQLLTPNLAPQNLGGHKGREAFEAAAGKLDAHLRLPGHSFAEEDSAYHANLRVVLASAVHDSVTGDALASIARSVLLGRVIVPYNRLFGRIKRPGELTGLAQRAAAEFDSLLRQPTLALNDAERQAAHGVFSQILRQLDDVARASRDRWKSWRLVWIPLNFALAPDQYDTQAEVDSILGALAEHPFSSANAVRYIYNDQFVAELRSSILATRRYHVLWIHDYAGRGSTGGPDQIAWGMAIDGYTEAFVRAIEEMDRGERDDLPEFLILLDEHYYRTNGSAKVLSFLESLGSNGGPKVPGGVVRDRVKAGVARLRSAIAASPSLKRNGEEYVRERVRVHVSITHPYDPTFVDDMIMRDHTKLAFYDVFEEDPGSGQALFTGLGVGEHYVGPHWEDRTLALRGTETVRVKDAARALLLSQGLKPEELPWFLRERPYWDHFGRDCDSLRALGWDADVLTVTNGTGFRSKSASVLKAAIYNLMQRGSVLIIPDSIWTCDYWAAVLVAAALRGCRVFPIAPALENAPSSALPTMGLMRATLWILYRSSEIFGDDIRSAGGMLRVGLYTNEVGVQDVARMLDLLLGRGWQRAPLGEQIKIDPSVIQMLKDEYARIGADSTGPTYAMQVPHPHRPHLHLKAQFFANDTAVRLLERVEWSDVLGRYLEARRQQASGVAAGREAIGFGLFRVNGSGTVSANDSVWVSPPFDDGHAIALSTLGSHNQDRRSMLLDGEVLTVVAGESCLPSLIDFAFLMGAATWPESAEELTRYFPEPSSLLRKISHWLHDFI